MPHRRVQRESAAKSLGTIGGSLGRIHCWRTRTRRERRPVWILSKGKSFLGKAGLGAPPVNLY